MQSPLNGERGTEYIATTNQKKELRNKGRDWIGQSDTDRTLVIFRLGVIFSGKKIALSLLLRGWGGGIIRNEESVGKLWMDTWYLEKPHYSMVHPFRR